MDLWLNAFSLVVTMGGWEPVAGFFHGYWWFVATSGLFQGASGCICEMHGSK